jgi:hypothetical protein
MIIIRTVSLTEAMSKYFPFKICAHALPPLYGHCMKRTAELFVFVVQDCPIAVGVEIRHKFWMCRLPRDVRQTSTQIPTTASSATYRR